jgi:response regulator of citrate/malate metabolism
MTKDKWFLNGGRGSGKTFRLLCETYENKITELEKACEETQELLDKQIEATYRLDKENAELKGFRQDCVKLTEDNVVMARQRAETSKQLAEATEIIKKLYTVFYDPCVTESDLKYRDELFAEIKQFLSEVEK